MKRYLLFAGDDYYPAGGWNDFRGDFDTEQEARDAVFSHYDWAHVVDSESGEVVESYGSR